MLRIFTNRFLGSKRLLYAEGGRQYFISIVSELEKKVNFTNSQDADIVHLFGGFIEPYKHKKIIKTHPSIHSLTTTPPNSFLKSLPRKILSKFYLKRMNIILTVSNFQKKYLQKCGLDNVKKLGVFIYHNHFKPMKKKQNEEFVIGFAGSFCKYKGAYELYDTIKALNKHREIKFLLAIRSYDSDLLYLKKKLLRMKNIEIYRDSNILRFYNSCNLMFLPFRTIYGTFPIPYVLLEAMSCGIPVLTTDIEPLKEIINGKNGFLSNKEDFPDKILELLNTNLNRYGKAARKYIIKNHDKKPILKRLLSIYGEFYEGCNN